MIHFSPVEVAHRFVRTIVKPGDRCVDATVGNGHDTAFLAGLVGQEGKVLGLDVQKEAIDAARRRLVLQNLIDSVTLKSSGHELLASQLGFLAWESVRLFMFNLGYLPGSAKTVLTQPETTLQALEDCRGFLAEDGAISIVAYRGHAGGSEEYEAVAEWISRLPSQSFLTVCYERWTHRKGSTPVFFWIRHRSS